MGRKLSIWGTPERMARIKELGRRIGSESETKIVDYALTLALVHTPDPDRSACSTSAEQEDT